jgi:hypothetical protein
MTRISVGPNVEFETELVLEGGGEPEIGGVREGSG